MNSRRKWTAFAGLCIGQALVSFNSSAITTVLSSIAREFEASLSELQWIVNGYVLIAASFVMLGGRFGEKFGRRRTFLTGLSVFLLGSVLSGMSFDTDMLFVGRFSQALGAALILPSILALIEDFFEGGERKLAFGIWGATSGVSSALAIFVSGAMAEFIDWRWIFWINVPFLLAGLVLIGVYFPNEVEKAPDPKLSIDYVGLSALALFALGLIVALDEIQISGKFNSLSAWFGVAGTVGLLLFVIAEMRSKTPIMALVLFKNRRFLGGLLAILVLNIQLYLLLFETNLFFQNKLGFAYSPFESGVALLPMSLCLLTATLLIGRLSRWISFESMTLAGIFFASLGMALLWRLSSVSHVSEMIIGLSVAGLGIGIGSAPAAAIVMDALGERFRSEAASFQMVVRYFGGALGVALGASIYSLSSTSTLYSVLKGSGVPLGEISAIDSVIVGASNTSVTLSTLLDPEHGAALKAGAQDALVKGFSDTMLCGAVCALISLLLCIYLLKRIKERTSH